MKSFFDTIVINGSERSGTTWLMEIFGKSKSRFPIYEPLDSRYIESRKLQLWLRYLNPDKHYPKEYNFFKILLSGNDNKLTRKYNDNSRFFIYNFNPNIIIFRHTCAVLKSALRFGPLLSKLN